MSKSKTNAPGNPLNESFEVLSHQYPRRILMAVARQSPLNEDDIVSESVGDVHEKDGAVETLQLQLYHKHLPKLAESGFINWDRNSDTITRGSRFEEIEPVLRLMHDHQGELLEDWP